MLIKLFFLSFPVSIVARLGANEIVGYYSWNWGGGSKISSATIGVAFTGLSDVDQAIAGYSAGCSWCCPALVGEHWISIGGGNAAGVMNANYLKQIEQKAAQIKTANYHGVMFDVEEVDGSASQVVPAFAAAFKSLKAAGLKVGVTTSHSAPYQTNSPSDAVALVKSWISDPNIDIISPQLYSSGQESSPDFAETSSCASSGCNWGLYKGSKAKFAPSIVNKSHYNGVKDYFLAKGITVSGFFQWQQVSEEIIEVEVEKEKKI